MYLFLQHNFKNLFFDEIKLTFITFRLFLLRDFFLEMNRELDSFDNFVDDIISSDENLLKGELDILLMQYIFNSLELENITNIDLDSKDLLAA